MRRNSLIAALFILLSLNRVSPARASEPMTQTVPTTASTVEQTKERGFAIWVQPVGAALIGALGGGVYLPFGMNIPLSLGPVRDSSSRRSQGTCTGARAPPTGF